MRRKSRSCGRLRVTERRPTSLRGAGSSVFDADRARRAELGGLLDLVPELVARLFLEDVEVAVAADLKHLRAHLHARAGARADVEVDHDTHDGLLSTPGGAGRDPAGR